MSASSEKKDSVHVHARRCSGGEPGEPEPPQELLRITALAPAHSAPWSAQRRWDQKGKCDG